MSEAKIIGAEKAVRELTIRCPKCGKTEMVIVARSEIDGSEVECDCGNAFTLDRGRDNYQFYAQKKAREFHSKMKVANSRKLMSSLQAVSARNKEVIRQRKERHDAEVIRWFQSMPGLDLIVEKARSELNYLQLKLQTELTRLTALKVDSSSHRQNVWQNNVDGLGGVAVTGMSALSLRGSMKGEKQVEAEISRLTAEVEKREKLIAKYDSARILLAQRS